MSKWTKTKFKGIRYREHPTRKYGQRKDRYYTIRYKLDGKDREERLGWESEWAKAEVARIERGEATGRSLEAEALVRLSDIRSNQKSGKGAFTLKEKREDELAKKEAESREKAETERRAMHFAAVWETYQEQAIADGKKSLDREASLYAHWISSVIADKPLTEIATIHLERIKSNMGKAEAAPRSIQYCLAVIRQVFNFATRRDLYQGPNPVGKVKMPTVDNRRMRFLTKDEADNLLKELENSRRKTSRRITLLSLHCGLRFGEIAALTWGDVDFERETLCIRNPKNGRTRFAYMTTTVRSELGALRAELDGIGACDRCDLVFPDRKGGRRKQMSDAFDRAVDALRLNDGITDPHQKICFHSCRHSFASWLAQGGTGLMVLKELLGHKSLSMTERYAHLLPDHLRGAVKRFDESLHRREEDTVGNLVQLFSGESSA